MTDTKKPTLSEIRARNEQVTGAEWNVEARETQLFDDIPYLLDLVSRMGKALGHYDGIGRDCTGCKEARALLEEINK